MLQIDGMDMCPTCVVRAGQVSSLSIIQMQIKTFKVCIVPASREVVLKTNRILCLLDEAQYSFIRITIFKSEIKTD
jgi:hypothetical protein